MVSLSNMAPKKRLGKVGKRQRRKINLHALSYQQKQHIKEFGEIHPSESREGEGIRYKKIKDVSDEIDDVAIDDKVEEDSSENEEEVTVHPFQELLSTIGGRENDVDAYESSNEDESEDEEEMEDDDSGLVVGTDDAEDEDVSEDDDEDEVVSEDDEDESVSEDDKDDVEDGEEENDDEGSGVETDDDLNEEEDGTDNDDDEDKEEEDDNNDDVEKTEGDTQPEEEFPEIRKIDVDDKEMIGKEDNRNEFLIGESDPFKCHFDKFLDEEDIDVIKTQKNWTKQQAKVPGLGKGHLLFPCEKYLPKTDYNEAEISKMHIKEKLVDQIPSTNSKMCNLEQEGLSPLQKGIFNVLNSYQDLYYTERTHSNQEEIRMAYCLHAINHVIKSRHCVVRNNTVIREKKATEDIDLRDQGLTRAKVLILVPFRESAFRIVQTLINLTRGKKTKIKSGKKFVEEYHEQDEEESKRVKPVDFDALFAGNIDDHFRIGLEVSTSMLKLFSHFYVSDILIASPLGLRTLIGGEGERGDWDFLSSIELLILDQTDVFLMQNWDHVLKIFSKMHLQPKSGHGVDFSRIRLSTLEGWTKYYRQTAIFSSILVPEITSLFNKQCFNYGGKIQIVRKPSSGTICQIVTQLPQMFHRFNCSSFSQACDDRFQFFIKKVLPDLQNHMTKHTMIFIPSYFDFVRIRNHFAREKINFVQMNEYVTDSKVSKYRMLFFSGKVPFMLYTERMHFYKRHKIRGIHNVIFYELPQYPHFYSEICNMLRDPKRDLGQVELTCSVIYCKYDAPKLSEIVGAQRTSVMLNSEKSVHMFVTGENS